MKFLPSLAIRSDVLQLLYAIAVIVFIPLAFAFNTLFTLKSVQRDMDYELNNKAMLVESVIGILSRDKLASPQGIQKELAELTTTIPDIRAIEIFKLTDDVISPAVTTSQNTSSVADPALNQLAWGTDKSYAKQIKAQLGTHPMERIWLVASPIKDANGKKIALINLYLSASTIDAISNRTVRDSFIIMAGTMLLILLLLLNHFRFFEISILFAKLNELDKLKDEFISTASHEFKSPLVVIGSYAQLLSKNSRIMLDDTVKKQVQIISDTTNRLKLLIDEMLDVSRIEQGRMMIAFVIVDIRDILADVVREHTPQAKEKGLTITYLPYPQPLPVSCDKEKLHQVFTNLVSNAVKYSESGAITITTEMKGNQVRVFVKDTGFGISDDDKKKLFGKFSRIQTEKTKDIPGTGLGLWITKQLLEKMNGTISVESIAGTGSQFIVMLPVATPATFSKPLAVTSSVSVPHTAIAATISPGMRQEEKVATIAGKA